MLLVWPVLPGHTPGMATRRYIDELDAQTVTDEVNAGLAAAGDDDSGAVAVASGLRVLDGE